MKRMFGMSRRRRTDAFSIKGACLSGIDELVILITIVDLLFRQEDEWSTCCASDDPACYGTRSSTPGPVLVISKI